MKTFIKIIFSLFLFQSVLFAAGKPYSQTEFDKLIKEGKPVVLHVHAKWCSTCATQDPILNSLMKTQSLRILLFIM
jgi:thioredoxin 1